MISMEKLENTIKVVQIMRKALELISNYGDGRESFGGHSCAEIAQQALKDVGKVGE